VHAPHFDPSTPVQNVEPLGGGGPQVPSVAPVAMLHTPVQQSVARAQTSPSSMQNDPVRSHLPVDEGQ
jgi:hypothetical protein